MPIREEVLFHDGRWLALSRPAGTIEARTRGEVIPALAEIEERVERDGVYGAGFISYESSSAFDPALRTRSPDGFPLLRFGLYRRLEETGPPKASGRDAFPAWTPSVGEAEYRRSIAAVREKIARGETYQVNYTYRLTAPFPGDGRGIFARMAGGQGGTGAFLDAGRYQVASASPELFFRREGDRIVTRPMKGTERRGRTAGEDSRLAGRLRRSAKNRAENLMIVDLLRNDLGKIAAAGTVETGPLFEIESYPTLFQMTSTVSGRTRASLPEILSALFPCGSVTGAPKPSTMGIIADLETTPRGVYTGAIGLVSPGRKALFLVAIRTLLIDRERETAEYGVGGGIVWDSRAGAEYAESRLKARIVTGGREEFSLLETIGWTPGEGYILLERHLERLEGSARHFGFAFDPARARRRLRARAAGLAGSPHKVRLLLRPDGSLLCSARPLPSRPDRKPLRVAFALSPVDSRDPFLRHKTTRREVYENARAGRPGFDEVILFNERGEVTEAAAANVVIRSGGELITPPLSSGLLPGTLRAELLKSGEIRERVIRREELVGADEIYLINSVRGRRRAVLIEPASGPGNRLRPQRLRPSG
ncbi:MAG: chorismate-binding protein [Candidatus Erginobacter occultus]|nr:chorismate-binding protein [Candidatus Erginobacter occultus]